MRNPKRRHVSILVLVISAAGLGACGKGPGGGGPPAASDAPATRETPAATASTPVPDEGAGESCLAAADVSRAVGLDVRDFPAGTSTSGDTIVCSYQLADEALGAFVTTVAGPSQEGEAVFDEMEETVALTLGAGVVPEEIAVGERGLAYGSLSRSEAAAISGGRLYHAGIVSSASADLGDRKDGMIEVLRMMMGG